VVGFGVAGLIVQSARANPGANNVPKVEFVEVNGHECLQSVVSEAGAQLADYRAAEARWLKSKYPGVAILLSPVTDAVQESERTTVQRETFYLDGIVGVGAVVCFDIKQAISPGKSHE